METSSPHTSPARAAPTRAVAPRRVMFRPDWAAARTAFRHTWEGVVNIYQSRWMVLRDVQEQLDLAQRELHARHVRAVGMYDDEMRVFCPSPASFMGYETKEPR